MDGIFCRTLYVPCIYDDILRWCSLSLSYYLYIDESRVLKLPTITLFGVIYGVTSRSIYLFMKLDVQKLVAYFLDGLVYECDMIFYIALWHVHTHTYMFISIHLLDRLFCLSVWYHILYHSLVYHWNLFCQIFKYLCLIVSLFHLYRVNFFIFFYPKKNLVTHDVIFSKVIKILHSPQSNVKDCIPLLKSQSQ